MGSVERNIAYAQQCMGDSLKRGEAPFASHLLYTQILDDTIPQQRMMGMQRAFEWYRCADLMAVYTDRGISSGMQKGMEVAEQLKIKIEYRKLDGNHC
jgi:hypothetical protein